MSREEDRRVANGGFAAALVVAAAAFGAPARAEDPAPAKAKHVNVVTPEAKAAIDRYARLVYAADRNGLKSCSGALVPIGLESHERANFEWTPPACADVRLPSGIKREMASSRMWYWPVRGALYAALHPDGLFDYDEFDARIAKRKDGVTTLAMSEYEDGEDLSSDEFVLDRDGLVTTRIHRAPAGSTSTQSFTASYTYGKVADAYRVETLLFETESPVPARYACTLRYADVAGVHVPVSYDIEFTPKEGASRKLTFHVADLVLNGKAVSLPTPWRHVNRVTPEAQVAIDRYERLVYKPTEHGLESISGAIVQAGVANATTRRFSFKAGGHVDVERENKPGESDDYRRGVQFALGTAFESTLAGIPLADGPEYDAEFADRDGERTLFVTQFRDGVKSQTNTFTLDDVGLLATFEVGGGEPSSRNRLRLRFTWQPSGELFRIATIELTFESFADKTSVRLFHELTYTDAAGLALVTSYRTQSSGTTGGRLVSADATYFIADVVVNGTKTEVPRPSVREMRISPEARTAFDRYLTQRYVPAAHGLASLSAKIVAGLGDPVPLLELAYSPATNVVLSAPKGVDAERPDVQRAASLMEFALIVALESVEVASGTEFEASFVERGGSRFVEIAGYSGGKRTETRELGFDDNGLLAALTLKFGEDPSKPDTTVRFRFTWVKTEGQFRVARARFDRNGQDGAVVRTDVALSYARIEGFDLPVSMSMTETGADGASTFQYALTNLVVNGKPVESPPAPADKK